MLYSLPKTLVRPVFAQTLEGKNTEEMEKYLNTL